MTDHIAISGNYADFKLVKTRSVAAVIIEIPLEKAEAFLSLFGVPQPGAEKPVALALLSTEKPKEDRPRQSWDNMGPAQQAGILCADKRFQEWLRVETEADAIQRVHRACGVRSRADIVKHTQAIGAWAGMVARYRAETGRTAEQRG